MDFTGSLKLSGDTNMPKDVIKKMLRKKLTWGCIVISLTQILGMLPALDFLPQMWLKIVSFSLACILTVAKAIEMFWGQVAELEKTVDTTYSSTSSDGSTVNQTSSTTTKTPQ